MLTPDERELLYLMIMPSIFGAAFITPCLCTLMTRWPPPFRDAYFAILWLFTDARLDCFRTTSHYRPDSFGGVFGADDGASAPPCGRLPPSRQAIFAQLDAAGQHLLAAIEFSP